LCLVFSRSYRRQSSMPMRWTPFSLKYFCMAFKFLNLFAQFCQHWRIDSTSSARETRVCSRLAWAILLASVSQKNARQKAPVNHLQNGYDVKQCCSDLHTYLCIWRKMVHLINIYRSDVPFCMYVVCMSCLSRYFATMCWLIRWAMSCGNRRLRTRRFVSSTVTPRFSCLR
jgi:hypothetical protein